MKKNNLRKAAAVTAAVAMIVVSTSAFAANTSVYGNGMLFNQNRQMFGNQQMQNWQQGQQIGGMQNQQKLQQNGMQLGGQQNGPQFGNQAQQPQSGMQFRGQNNQFGGNQPLDKQLSVFDRIQDFGGQVMDRLQQMNPFGGQQHNNQSHGQMPDGQQGRKQQEANNGDLQFDNREGQPNGQMPGMPNGQQNGQPQNGQQQPQPGEMPQNSEQPTPPSEQQPEVTEAPSATEEPVAAEEPVATEAPAATEEPKVTEAPAEEEETEEDAFTATFNVESHASITVSATQDFTDVTQNALKAYAKDGDTGAITTDGSGQINFMVVVDSGYEVDSVTVEPENYKNLKVVDTNTYRVTKITGDIIITVTTKAAASDSEETAGDGIIYLNGDSIDASGVENVTVNGSIVTITAAGEYDIDGTLADGQIVVATADKSDEVTLNLNGVNVVNTTGNALNATTGKVTLLVNSDSTFTSLSTGDDQTAIFSKNDLTIKGAGTLTAISESGNGIRCKNDLDIGDVDLVVNAGNNGIKGDESVKITKKNRSVTVTAGGDGIKTDELPYYDEETGEYVTGGVITINGGNVIVNAAEDGIQSDTLLTVNAGALDITAGGEALKSNASSIDYLEDSTVEASPAEGDGCIVINGGTINAVSGEDGIKATKDVTVNDGTVTVKSALDGIQAGDETEDENYQVNGILTINGGTLDITSGGGHTSKTNPTLSDSMKGIKSNYQLTVNGGDITVNSRDDSVHCDYRIDITGGTLTLDSDDDGVHADSYLYVSDNADINVQSSYEGIEAAEIYMSGGSAKVVAKDDGINAAGDNPNGTAAAAVSSSNRGGFGGGMGVASSYGYIEVSGGYLYIEAEGDGFDSNGNALISGGEVYVNGPTSGGNGVFDVGESNNTLVITGGNVIGAGTSDMAVTPTQSNGSQAYVVTNVSTQSAGKAIKLTDASGNTIVNYTPSKNYSWVLISTPDMVSGQSYTLTYGTNQTTLTAQTSGGSNGMGGQPGGNMGGQIGGRR